MGIYLGQGSRAKSIADAQRVEEMSLILGIGLVIMVKCKAYLKPAIIDSATAIRFSEHAQVSPGMAIRR